MMACMIVYMLGKMCGLGHFQSGLMIVTFFVVLYSGQGVCFGTHPQ